ncbi:hypothetical protein AGMMS49982_13970 [Bacteroidia bacterium]|nr:hypothetical protein AGMMS49982_13970 [Bacteroidia bacterium]
MVATTNLSGLGWYFSTEKTWALMNMKTNKIFLGLIVLVVSTVDPLAAPKIDLGKITDTKIEETLFGHNLEHTRSAVYQGLSAQLLRNRKFAGKPAAHFGEPAEWYRVGAANAFITLDPRDAYVKHIGNTWKNFIVNNEINSVVIQNPQSNQKAGIGQKSLALKGGAAYTAKVIAKVRGDDLPLNVTITVAGSDGKVQEKKTFSLEGGDWQTCEFSVTPQNDDTNASFEISFSQRAELKLGVASLLPTDNFHGMRKDAVALMKEIGNEFGHGHMEGLNTPEDYAKKANSCAEAIKKVDSSIKFFSSGPYGPGWHSADWTSKGLAPMAKHISYLSFHAAGEFVIPPRSILQIEGEGKFN